MTPLRIRAYIPGQVSLPNGPMAIDGLLAYQAALLSGLPPATRASECQSIDIPIAKAPTGRFHLCSWSVGTLADFDVRWVNRRAPVEQYQTFGLTGTAKISLGADKSYRIPLEVGHLANGVLDWFCIGDSARIAELLAGVCYVGKKRNVGLGKVERWEVEAADTWEGFPVVRDGQPLRALPINWPDLAPDAPRARRTLTYPYWDFSKQELLACPL